MIILIIIWLFSHYAEMIEMMCLCEVNRWGPPEKKDTEEETEKMSGKAQ